jgi:hypothetical protein
MHLTVGVGVTSNLSQPRSKVVCEHCQWVLSCQSPQKHVHMIYMIIYAELHSATWSMGCAPKFRADCPSGCFWSPDMNQNQVFTCLFLIFSFFSECAFHLTPTPAEEMWHDPSVPQHLVSHRTPAETAIIWQSRWPNACWSNNCSHPIYTATHIKYILKYGSMHAKTKKDVTMQRSTLDIKVRAANKC